MASPATEACWALRRWRGGTPHWGQATVMVGKGGPETGQHGKGRRASTFSRKGQTGLQVTVRSGSRKHDQVNKTTHGHGNQEQGGWEAAEVAAFLLRQLCPAVWKTRTCPFVSPGQHPDLPCTAGAAAVPRASEPGLPLPRSWNLEIHNTGILSDVP